MKLSHLVATANEILDLVAAHGLFLKNQKTDTRVQLYQAMKATKERLESHGEPAHPSFLLSMASCAFINGFVAADYDAAFDAINPSVISPLVRATTSRCGKEVQIEVDRIVGSVIQEPIMEITRLLPMTDFEPYCLR